MDLSWLRQEYGLDVQSMLLLRAGLKPVIRLGVDPSQNTSEKYRALESYCGQYGVVVRVATMDTMFGTPLAVPMSMLYVARDDRLADAAFVADRSGDRVALGRLLGYPDCCVKRFVERVVDSDAADLMRLTYADTKGSPSFYCNNIFNFDSRLRFGIDFEIYTRNYQLFNGIEPFFLIRHVPCAFDCPESIRMGERMLELLMRHDPVLADTVVGMLQGTVLYFDYFNWLIFKGGTIKDGVLRYARVSPVESLIASEVRRQVREGDALECNEGRVTVYKQGKKMSEFLNPGMKPGVIMHFS